MTPDFRGSRAGGMILVLADVSLVTVVQTCHVDVAAHLSVICCTVCVTAWPSQFLVHGGCSNAMCTLTICVAGFNIDWFLIQMLRPTPLPQSQPTFGSWASCAMLFQRLTVHRIESVAFLLGQLCIISAADCPHVTHYCSRQGHCLSVLSAARCELYVRGTSGAYPSGDTATAAPLSTITCST